MFSIYGVGRHNRYNSSALDLGIQDNVLWNTIHGRPFQCSIETSIYLGDHFTLTIPIYSFVYLIWNDVRSILIVQTVLLAFGAFAIAKLASKKLKIPWAGPAAALAFLLYPPLGFIARFDFHPEVAVIPLFLFAIYCFEDKKIKLGYLLTLLVLFSKEQYGLVIGMWGISLMVFERKWQRGLLFCALGFGWSYLALFHFIPAFRGGSSDTLFRYQHIAVTPGQLLAVCITDPVRVLSALFGSPDRQRYLWQLLWPLAGLWLLSPRIFLIALPVIFYNLLSSNVNQHSLFYQYNAPLIPWLFWGALQGLSELKQGRGWLYRKWPSQVRLRIARAGFVLLPLGVSVRFHSLQSFYNPDSPSPFRSLWMGGTRKCRIDPGGLPIDSIRGHAFNHDGTAPPFFPSPGNLFSLGRGLPG